MEGEALVRLQVERWSIEHDDPPLAMAGTVVICNGAEVRRIRAFDVAEGWVEVICQSGHTGYPNAAHLDPADSDRVCVRRIHGEVEVWIPTSADRYLRRPQGIIDAGNVKAVPYPARELRWIWQRDWDTGDAAPS